MTESEFILEVKLAAAVTDGSWIPKNESDH
jgi:hypothetical protein